MVGRLVGNERRSCKETRHCTRDRHQSIDAKVFKTSSEFHPENAGAGASGLCGAALESQLDQIGNSVTAAGSAFFMITGHLGHLVSQTVSSV